VWPILLIVLGALGYAVYLRIQVAKAQSAVNGRMGPRTFPVVAAVARRGSMPVYLNGLGTVTAFETVTARSRVDGELMKVHFTEGQLVKKDDLLAEIDPRPFQVQLTQAEGQMAKDQAQLQNAQLDLSRFESIKESMTPQQIDGQKALVNQLQGAVKTDQGMIDNAKLQLTYCRITAPLSGRVGLRIVDEGNIIHANDLMGLVVITELQPIAVNFYLREDDISEVLKRLTAGEQLPVDAMDHDAKSVISSGTLLATDNQVDPATGTLRFKAVFENKDGALFPNQFVNARLLLTSLNNVVIVPAAAVQRGPNDMTFVYAVHPGKKGATQPAGGAASVAAAPGSGRGGARGGGATTQPLEGTVALKTIVAGHQEGDDMVIESGLEPGDIVVTDGVDKLQDGTSVTYRVQPPTSRPATRPAGGLGATTRPSAPNARPGGRGRRGEE
jgi:multidrug efflux system membrane fusion protein